MNSSIKYFIKVNDLEYIINIILKFVITFNQNKNIAKSIVDMLLNFL